MFGLWTRVNLSNHGSPRKMGNLEAVSRHTLQNIGGLFRWAVEKKTDNTIDVWFKMNTKYT